MVVEEPQVARREASLVCRPGESHQGPVPQCPPLFVFAKPGWVSDMAAGWWATGRRDRSIEHRASPLLLHRRHMSCVGQADKTSRAGQPLALFQQKLACRSSAPAAQRLFSTTALRNDPAYTNQPSSSRLVLSVAFDPAARGLGRRIWSRLICFPQLPKQHQRSTSTARDQLFIQSIRRDC